VAPELAVVDSCALAAGDPLDHIEEPCVVGAEGSVPWILAERELDAERPEHTVGLEDEERHPRRRQLPVELVAGVLDPGSARRSASRRSASSGAPSARARSRSKLTGLVCVRHS
jgi:hypothetical protein